MARSHQSLECVVRGGRQPHEPFAAANCERSDSSWLEARKGYRLYDALAGWAGPPLECKRMNDRVDQMIQLIKNKTGV